MPTNGVGILYKGHASPYLIETMRNSIRLAILPVLIGVLTAPTAGRVVCTAWSPDGETIAFTSDRDGDGELFELNLETGEVRQLTFNDCPDEHPT